MSVKELALFAGQGGGIYGSMILGWNTVAYVEKNKYCQKVLRQRMQDGWFDNGEIYDDITEFNANHAHKYRGLIDVITGGFPCQPHSVAGKREGASDERYLWCEIEKTIEIVRPERLFFENVRGLLSDAAIIDVCRIIEGLGYQLSAPLLLGSDDCGNIHERKRVWIYATDPAQQPRNACGTETTQHKKQSASESRNSNQQFSNARIRSFEQLLSESNVPEPVFCGMDDELPDRRQQLTAIGNGQDPIVMATAYRILSGEFL
ncbi:DNA cytosine methyltransferase [Psychrobacter cibarius]|nr:DNA cytosine methyltransferase [Psychrobacter cibarius]